MQVISFNKGGQHIRDVYDHTNVCICECMRVWYMCVCVYICVCMFVCMLLYISIFAYCIKVSIWTYCIMCAGNIFPVNYMLMQHVHVRACVSAHVCVPVCICVSVHV